MNMDRAKVIIKGLLAEADVRVDGGRPWDIRVKDERFYPAVFRGGTLAFGESYMAGWWGCDALDELVAHLFAAKTAEKVKFTPGNIIVFLRSLLGNDGARSRAFEIGERHYDIGNDVFQRMLDRRMTYTCGYWRGAKDLEAAQEAKLDLVCRKIGLKRGQTVLDIGCGWGSFAKFAAEKYGVRVTGITVSKEQIKLGQELCKKLPVELRLEDYRDVRGVFDRIVSLGMFEHVGYKNYRTYMRTVHDHLRDDGLFLLHTIGTNSSLRHTEPWIHKYIFPNGMIPSVAQIGRSIEKLFVPEDWHNFGADYDKTLMAWFANFDRRWPEISTRYGDTFYRMWKFYLLSSAGAFRARANQLWQVVLSKEGVRGGYVSVR
jgi:cyclopropane-fatty-acyl-phospholipid synthase